MSTQPSPSYSDGGDRIVAYAIDLTVVSTLVTVILAHLGIAPIIFIFLVVYSLNFGSLLQLPVAPVAKTVLALLVVGVAYFSVEPFIGGSPGKRITSQRLVLRRDVSGGPIPKVLARALLKATVIPAILDDFGLIRRRRIPTRFSDERLGFVVVYASNAQSYRRRTLGYFAGSALIYFLPLLVAILSVSFLSEFSAQTQSQPLDPSLLKGLTFWNVFWIIIGNNLGLDLRFIIGGLLLLLPTLLSVFLSAFLDGALLASIPQGTSASLIPEFLPQFLLETGGYVFGILSGCLLLNLTMGVVMTYTRGTRIDSYGARYRYEIRFVILTALVSLVLIALGALVESYQIA
jgi:hypothetical protein